MGRPDAVPIGSSGKGTGMASGRNEVLTVDRSPLWAADQLAEQASRLARRNAALEDFAALVAHDVRSWLLSALLNDAPREGVKRALELVDSILEAVHADQASGGAATVSDCVRHASVVRRVDRCDTPRRGR